MEWLIELHDDAVKSLNKKIITKNELKETITKAIRKFKGEDVNINIAKLRGNWTGFYRIKLGKIRLIAYFDFDKKKVFVRDIEYRGKIYK